MVCFRSGLPWRLRVAAGLLAGLRVHDLRAARTFIQTSGPGGALPVRLARFLGWTLRQMFAVIPDTLHRVRFARPVDDTPYWLAQGNPLANHPWAAQPAAVLPATVDTLVIGAGFTGASLAYFWSKSAPAGRELIVLDMGDAASGASGRNAGTIVMGRYFATIVRTVGAWLPRMRPDLGPADCARLARQFAGAYCRAAYRNADLIERTIREEGFDCEYARLGWVQVRLAEERAALDESVRMAEESGFTDWTSLDPKKVWETAGIRVPAPAGFSQRAGSFHPAKWVWCLLRAALMSGKISHFSRTKVLRVADEGEQYLVRTDRGEIRARHVVNATEAYTAALHPQLHDHLFVMQSQAAAGIGAPEDLKPVAVSGATWFGDRRGDHTLFGTDQTRIPDSAAAHSRPSRFLTKFAAGELMAYTGKFSIEVTHEWSGAVGFTPDEYPLVGLLDGKRQYLIGGMCGSGTGVSFNAARCIVGRILGQSPESDDYPPGYFAPTRLLDPARHPWPAVVP